MSGIAWSQAVEIPSGYTLIRGQYLPNGRSGGGIEIQVDSLTNPTKGYLTKNTSACVVKKAEVPLRKIENGFSVDADLGGQCRMSNYTFIGPDKGGNFTGSYGSWAGAGSLSLTVQK